MGFRDYYRQFDDLDRGARTARRASGAAASGALALERVPDLDLSGTEWPDLPHSEIVNAAIARARGRVNGYPDRHASGRAPAAGRAPRRGARADRCSATAPPSCCSRRRMALLGRGDELLMPWPSYPLYPLMAAHACATPVAVDRGGRCSTR